MSAEAQPRRRYDGSRRQAQARATQREVIRAAHDLFVSQGYGATTIAGVAAAAGVSVPTVYAGFTTKAELLRRAIEVAMAGDDDPVAVADRPTAQWVADTDDPAEMLSRDAVACGEMVERIGAIYPVLSRAAGADPALADLLERFEAQRLTAATAMAAAVRDRGGLPDGVSIEDARDLVWMANSPEVRALAVTRGRSTERYVAFVRRLLLDVIGGAPG